MPFHEGSPLDVAVNSYGIALPPPPVPCSGDCINLKTEEGCSEERHHLHIGEPIYREHSPLAEDFRDLRVLTVWMPSCIHDELHDVNKFSIQPPSDDVMEQAIHEDLILKQIGQNFANLRDAREQLALAQKGSLTKHKLDYSYKKYSLLHETLLERVGEIEVVPAQLVTGFLLITAPKLARRRVFEGTGFALTASSKSFRPEIYDPVDDFILGGILHEGQEVKLRPSIVPHKESNDAQSETPSTRLALQPITAVT